MKILQKSNFQSFCKFDAFFDIRQNPFYLNKSQILLINVEAFILHLCSKALFRKQCKDKT